MAKFHVVKVGEDARLSVENMTKAQYATISRLFGASGRASNQSNSRRSGRSKLSVKTSSQRLNMNDTLARGDNLDLSQSATKSLSPTRRNQAKRVNSAKQRAMEKKLKEYY